MVILMCDFALEKGEMLVTPEIISLKMALDFQTIDQILSTLMNRGYISLVDNNGKLQTSLFGIQDLLIKTFVLELKKESSNEPKQETQDIITLFENDFGRPLTYIEIEIIKSWLDEGFKERVIKSALHEATIARAKNIRYIDKILLDWKRQEEKKQEGHSSVSEKHRGDLKESLKTSRLKWVNKD